MRKLPFALAIYRVFLRQRFAMLDHAVRARHRAVDEARADLSDALSARTLCAAKLALLQLSTFATGAHHSPPLPTRAPNNTNRAALLSPRPTNPERPMQ